MACCCRTWAKAGAPPIVLQERLEQAAANGPAALLAAWREGLAAIAAVHACGCYLSQAFARNLVLCPDGVIGYIDFEDDPGATLTLAECQARDWLSYLHSTAALVDAASPHTAGAHWNAALTIASDAVRQRLVLAAGTCAGCATCPPAAVSDATRSACARSPGCWRAGSGEKPRAAADDEAEGISGPGDRHTEAASRLRIASTARSLSTAGRGARPPGR